MADESSYSRHFYYLDKTKVVSSVDMLVPGMLPRVGVGILYGASSTGKSLLCMRLATSIAMGEPLVTGSFDPKLGVPRHTGRTVYFCGEGESGYYTRERAAILALPKNLRDMIFTQLPGLPIIPFGIGYDKLSGIDQLGQINQQIKAISEKLTCDRQPIRLMIFDTLLACFDIHDENNNAEMQRVYDALRQFAKTFECFVLVVTHPTKGSKHKAPTLRGAGSAGNSVDIIMELKRVNASAFRELTIKKVRDGMKLGGRFSFKEIIVDDSAAMIPDDRWADEYREAENNKAANRILDKDRIYTAIQEGKLQALNKDEALAYLSEILETSRKAEGKQRSQAAIKKQVQRSLGYLLKDGWIKLDETGKPMLADTTTGISAVPMHEPLYATLAPDTDIDDFVSRFSNAQSY